MIKNSRGFTMVELMIAIGILSIIFIASFTALQVGIMVWSKSDTNVILDENLQMALDKVKGELRRTGFDSAGAFQLTLTDNTGVNGSDIIQFSIPVVCQSNGSLIDASGNIANWRAPLTWGCTSSSCMDADNSCATVDYRYIQYVLINGNFLVRRVLNAAQALVREDRIASNISNFQITISADRRSVTVLLTASRISNLRETISASLRSDIALRNI